MSSPRYRRVCDRTCHFCSVLYSERITCAYSIHRASMDIYLHTIRHPDRSHSSQSHGRHAHTIGRERAPPRSHRCSRSMLYTARALLTRGNARIAPAHNMRALRTGARFHSALMPAHATWRARAPPHGESEARQRGEQAQFADPHSAATTDPSHRLTVNKPQRKREVLRACAYATPEPPHPLNCLKRDTARVPTRRLPPPYARRSCRPSWRGSQRRAGRLSSSPPWRT